jgi:cytochrome c biogenesis protein CcmG/thiol:disulfide interchange protein DsbE
MIAARMKSNDAARGVATRSLVLIGTALAIVGCGSSESSTNTQPDYDKALAGSPAPLAALHDQANRLLPGGVDAYEKRIERLRGYPVVANVWASWCGPCRIEIPYFQRAGARYGKRVAFLGIDRQDSDDAAHTFLREEPVSYPSYRDPDEAISTGVGAELGMPDTAFYNRGGELVYLKQGPYETMEELVADIHRYALAGGTAESG